MKKYYIAYGSNLNSGHMENLCPSAKFLGKVILNNFALSFEGEKDRCYLNIRKVKDKNIEVGVFELNDKDIFKLDEYEDYPLLYKKEDIEIELNNKKIKAFYYCMDCDYSPCKPNKEYVEMCLKGYLDYNIKKEQLEEILYK